MSDSRDVLGKADEFLRRHSMGRTSDDSIADVPVLTDRIGPRFPVLPTEEATSRGFHVDDSVARELTGEIIVSALDRIEADLERRLAQKLVSDVRSTIKVALSDLRQDIANAVGDAIAEALSKRRKG